MKDARSPARAWLHDQPWLPILLAYLLLALLYGLINPLFEAPDEPQHFWFVKHLADGNGLPVQGPAGLDTWAQEGSQPPLYYLVGSMLIRGIDTDDVDGLLWFNPHVNMGVPLAFGNKNVYIHAARPGWPWRGATLAVHILRWFSTLLGAGTLLGIYTIMRMAFPQTGNIAPAAMALTAFMPQFLFITAAVNNDNLVTCCATWALWAILRLWHHVPTWRDSLLIGTLIGLATMAKLSGLALAAPLGLTLLALWWRGRDLKRLVAMGLVAGIVALAIAGWWFGRNIMLYGDLTGLSAMLDVFGRREVAPGLAALLAEAQGLRISYWAIFGWFNILSWPPLYVALDILSLLALSGLALWTIRQRRALTEEQWAWLFTMLGWFLILLISLVRWTRMTSGTQGRLLFPAVAAISGLLTCGWHHLWPTRHHGHAGSARSPAYWVVGFFFLWAALCPFLHIQPAYALPEKTLSPVDPHDAQPLNIHYGDLFELVSYRFQPTTVAPGEMLTITAYWRCLRETNLDYSIYVHLLGRNGEPIGQMDTYPGLGTYPTSLWQAGELIRDVYQVTISPTAMTPTLARVEIGPYLYRQEAEPLPMSDGEGRPLTSPLLGRVRVAPTHPVDPPQDLPNPSQVVFSDAIALRGHKLATNTVEPGGSFPLTTYWQALGELERPYTVFVHLVAEDGALGGQGDGPPLNGDYPVDAWRPGDFVQDTRIVQVKADVAPGTYRLLIGFYDLETGQRLTTSEGLDHAVLGRMTVSW